MTSYLPLASDPARLPDLVLRSPDSVVASVPHLLGFTPEESVVLLWMGGGRLRLTERLDLPEVVTDDVIDAWLAAVWSPIEQVDADDIIVVFVTARPERASLSSALVVSAELQGILVRDVLWLAEGRWGSLLCSNEECCPAEGTELDPSAATRVHAEFALLGSAPLQSRENVKRELQVSPSQQKRQRRAMTSCTWVDTGDRTVAEWRTAVCAAITDGIQPDGSTMDDVTRCGIAALGLRDVVVRDLVLWEMATWEADRLRPWADLMRTALTGARRAEVAPLAACIAICSWLLGDGARAVCAVERAIKADANYSLVRLVDAALASGLHPEHWRACMADLTKEVILGEHAST